MGWLLFLARVAFICNLCFVVCMVLLYVPVTVPQFISGAIVTLGFIAIIVNAIVQILLLIFRSHVIPKWLFIFNLVLFVLQIIYFLV